MVTFLFLNAEKLAGFWFNWNKRKNIGIKNVLILIKIENLALVTFNIKLILNKSRFYQQRRIQIMIHKLDIFLGIHCPYTQIIYKIINVRSLFTHLMIGGFASSNSKINGLCWLVIPITLEMIVVSLIKTKLHLKCIRPLELVIIELLFATSFQPCVFILLYISYCFIWKLLCLKTYNIYILI